MSRQNPVRRRRAASPPSVLPLQVIAVSQLVDLMQNARFLVDCTAGSVALTLPPAVSVPRGSAYEADKIAGVPANTLALTPSGTDTINGVNATFNLTNNGMAGAQFVSDGVGAWQITLSDSASVAAGVTKIVSGILTIAGGTSTITSVNLGLGNLTGKPIVCSIKQAAFDATATRVQALDNGVAGTITINSDANATAPLDVAFFIDAR